MIRTRSRFINLIMIAIFVANCFWQPIAGAVTAPTSNTTTATCGGQASTNTGTATGTTTAQNVSNTTATGQTPQANSSCWDPVYAALNDVLYYSPCGGNTSSTAQNASNTTTAPAGGAPSGVPNTPGVSCGGDEASNKKEIHNYLAGMGYNENAIYGIMGNMEAESNFSSGITNPQHCLGIVQWCGTDYPGREGEMHRKDNMTAAAVAQGRQGSCLGAQLDYLNYEIKNSYAGVAPDKLNQAGSPSAAATQWNEIFEGSGDTAGTRERNAENLAHGIDNSSGAAITPSTAQTASNTSSTSCPSPATPNSGATGNPASLSADCKSSVDTINKLESEGKISYNSPQAKEDVQRCGQVVNCQSGIDANTARGLAGVASQSGVSHVQVSALNGDHDCDGADHGKGLAMDLAYNQNDPEGEKAYKYLYDHAGELGVDKLIWGTVDTPGWIPMPGYQCMYHGQPIDCYNTYSDDHNGGGNHSDHIHVSMNRSGSSV